jgi:hypothetical protein
LGRFHFVSICNAESLFLVISVGSALSSNKSLTIAEFLISKQLCNGAYPSPSTALMFAPPLTRRVTIANRLYTITNNQRGREKVVRQVWNIYRHFAA